MNTPNVQTHAALQAFAFDSHAVRVIHKHGESWFVAKDVCRCLGVKWNGSQTLGPIDADEKDDVGITDSMGRKQTVQVINESGLYTLTLRCQGATTPGHPAHTFRKWLTSEVLPALRKTGQYVMPNVQAPATSVDARLDRIITVLERLVEVLPDLVRPAAKSRRRPPMFEHHLVRVFELRDAGATLTDIVRVTGFGQTSLYHVLRGEYDVLPGGRIQTKRDSRVTDKDLQRPAADLAQGGLDFGGKP
jgi:prophage antirepressor-like protein